MVNVTIQLIGVMNQLVTGGNILYQTLNSSFFGTLTGGDPSSDAGLLTIATNSSIYLPPKSNWIVGVINQLES